MRLIDADTAIEKFNEAEDYKGYLKGDPEIILNSIPTVDAVPVVHAHWFAEKDDGGFFDFCLCSNCKFDFRNEIAWVLPSVELPHYCPRCGAKMDEGVSG